MEKLVVCVAEMPFQAMVELVNTQSAKEWEQGFTTLHMCLKIQ
jgi:hypothetical protein